MSSTSPTNPVKSRDLTCEFLEQRLAAQASSSTWESHTVQILDEFHEVPDGFISDFMDYLSTSPTAWNAVDQTRERLLKAGFTELSGTHVWTIEHGKSYFVTRNGSALIAFTTPLKKPTEARIIGAHTDSPGLKLKPECEKIVKNCRMLAAEVYGWPTISTFLDRPLGLAGQVIVQKASGDSEDPETHSICIQQPLAIIPPLAIHLDRCQGETLTINLQKHLPALAGVNKSLPEGMSLVEFILKELGGLKFDKIVGSELFLTPLDLPTLSGLDSFLHSPRLDDLLGAYTSIKALTDQKNPLLNRLRVVALWDNEEVGSMSMQGAQSQFLRKVLKRVTNQFELSSQEEDIFFANSYLVSNDVAHAVHPNYVDEHEPNHLPELGGGPVIKFNANQKYATSAKAEAILRVIANRFGINLQTFVTRSDKPCGSTIGPFVAAALDILTVDIGAPILSMHSAVETTTPKDCEDLYKLLYHVLQD